MKRQTCIEIGSCVSPWQNVVVLNVGVNDQTTATSAVSKNKTKT